MGLGGYAVTIEGASGKPTQTIARMTRGGRPQAGDEIEIDGVLYRVRRVRHETSDGRSVRVYTYARLFVRRIRVRAARRRR